MAVDFEKFGARVPRMDCVDLARQTLVAVRHSIIM